MSPEQKKLFGLFKEIVEICDRHNIVYYLAGGTLIGAIRHKGFIPWDDDMDIMMPRKDWEKFLEVTKYDIPPNRVVECQERNRDYPNMFGRYTDTTTSAIHYNQILLDHGAQGYVIDILVLDPIPDTDVLYRKYCEDLTLFSDLVNVPLNYSYAYEANKDRLEAYYDRMMTEGKESVLPEIEKEFTQYTEECDYVTMRWGCYPLLFEKDMYGSSRWGEFEGLKVRIPDRTYDYLVQHYGDDWMYIPQGMEQVSHNAIFSATTDYKTLRKDFISYIDVPKTWEAIIKRKMNIFKNMDALHKEQDMAARIIASYAKIITLSEVEQCGENPEDLLNTYQYEKLECIFRKFYKHQWSADLIGRQEYLKAYRYHRPVYCDIGDRLLKVALMHLIHTNRVAKADRFLEVREAVKGSLTEELLEVRNLIKRLRKYASDDDLGRKEEAFAAAKELYEELPGNFSVKLFYIGKLVEKGEYDRVRQLSMDALKMFPKAGEFDKYIADCDYAKASNSEELWEVYEAYYRAVSRTTNGILRWDIREKGTKDKDKLLSYVKTAKDYKKAVIMTELVPDDVDYLVLKYETYLESTEDGRLSIDMMLALKNDLFRYEFDERLKNVLVQSYQKNGDSPQTASLRCELSLAKTDKQVQIVHQKIQECLNHSTDTTLVNLLHDAEISMGLKSSEVTVPLTKTDIDVNQEISETTLTGEQKTSLALLQEVEAICQENHIEHYLGFASSALALTSYHKKAEYTVLDMLIPADQIQTFIDAVNRQKRQDRELDYMGCGAYNRYYQVAYVDKTTTYFEMKSHINHSKHGMKVMIYPIRKTLGSLNQKWNTFLEAGWEYNGQNSKKQISMKRKLAAGVVKSAMVLGENRFGNYMFHRFNQIYGGKAEKYWIRFKRKVYMIHARSFREEKIELAGTRYPVMSGVEKLLKKYFGQEWMEKLNCSDESGQVKLISEKIPYDKFLKKCQEDGNSIEDYRLIRYESEIKRLDVNEENVLREQMLLIAQRSGERLRFYEMFQEKREIIQNLYRNQNFKALEEIFGAYNERTEFYAKKGLGLCASEEYMQIQRDILKHQGKDELAETVKALIPKEHYKPLGYGENNENE